MMLLCSKNLLQEGEEVASCPFCPYFEIRYSSSGANFVHCRGEKCKKCSCIICKKECPSFSDGFVTREDSLGNQAALEKHFMCAELKAPKLMVEQAIEHGFKIPCPSCHVSGMKDNACTHMTCSNCSQVWCYFCGRKESDCNKEDPAGSIYSHNEDWQDNIGTRCPMFLSSLSETHDWPVHEDDCLALFHNLRTRCLLQRAVRALGRPMCDRLDAHFSTLSSCGYSMEEIESAGEKWPAICAVIQHGAGAALAVGARAAS
jgi:hypothetical protein